MIKFRLYFDKDKETAYLNEMANKGWAMQSFFAGFYTFTECEPGKYEYGVDFSDSFGSVTEEYRELVSESGMEIVQLWGPWVILRKEKATGPLLLYTDLESQIEHYSKIRRMFKAVTIFELFILIYEIINVSYLTSSADVGSKVFLWGICLLIAAFVLTFMKAIIGINNKIRSLKEKKTGIEMPKNGNISVFLPIGLLFNSIALMANDLSRYITLPIQILAIIFMVIGIILTCSRRKEEREME